MNALRKKRPENVENWIFHQDNAPIHKAHATQDLLKMLGFRLLEHPPYSPDLAPCDFSIFPYLKKQLRGIKYRDIEHLKQKTIVTLRSTPTSFFKETFASWVTRHELCIKHQGVYFEKE